MSLSIEVSGIVFSLQNLYIEISSIFPLHLLSNSTKTQFLVGAKTKNQQNLFLFFVNLCT